MWGLSTPHLRKFQMKVEHSKGHSFEVELTRDEVSLAIAAFLLSHRVNIREVASIRIDGKPSEFWQI
jgi:hypothetical protein